jgi:molybdopterin molybdotransferase
MDGYALAWPPAQEGERSFRVSQVVAAGAQPQPLKLGEAARIMTGAPLPEGANTVVIQEDVEASEEARLGLGGLIHLNVTPQRGDNVRLRGEERAQGELLVGCERPLNPASLALLASQGLTHVEVWAPPRVALLSTGDELIHPPEEPTLGQRYSSNATLLRALVESAGGVAIDCGVARDTPTSTREGFERALAHAPDLILSTGGVSVGDFDPVRGVLADLGAQLHFWKVRMKPGKPLAVGEIGKCPILALPGNPVSAAVSFLLFAWPLLRRAQGSSEESSHLPRQTLPLAEPIEKRHGRVELMRVRRVSAGGAFAWALAGGQSSAWLSPLANADALLLLPAEPVAWAEGAEAEGLLLPWG